MSPLIGSPYLLDLCPTPKPWAGETGRMTPLNWALGSIQTCVLPCRYLCCETQMELREWFATFLFVQVPWAGMGWGGMGSREAPSWKTAVFASLFFRPPVTSRF